MNWQGGIWGRWSIRYNILHAQVKFQAYALACLPGTYRLLSRLDRPTIAPSSFAQMLEDDVISRFFQCIANYMCIAYMGPIKGGRSRKQQKYHRLWKRERLAICPQDWTMGFLCLCRRRIFFMFFGPRFFKPSPTSLEQLWWSCGEGQTLGSLHMPHNHAACWYSHIRVFLEAEKTQHQTLLTFFLKENINIWTPPRDLDKL